MITSSNFFNKSMFNPDEDMDRDYNQIGPWKISKQRKFATLDIQRRNKNKSQNRYTQKKYSQPPLLYSRKFSSKLSTHEYNIHLQHHQSTDINTKIRQQQQYQKQRNRNESFLPQIENNKKSHKLTHFDYSPTSASPLAYELNFITKKNLKKNRKLKYLSDYIHCSKDKETGQVNLETVQKYLPFQNQSKYNIYERCVVEIKRNGVNKSKEL